MASAVKIKRGDGTPVAGADGSNGVWPYELAWDYTNNKLYINDNGTMREVGGGSVSAVANGSNNRIATFSSSTALNGEGNLTFNGTTLAITGSLTASGNATISGTASVTSSITTGYGVAFTNGNTNFLVYNNTNDDLLYLRDTTNSAMLQTWTPTETTIHKNLVVDGGLLTVDDGGDANEGGEIVINPGTSHSAIWRIDSFHGHLRFFSSTTSGEQIRLTHDGHWAQLTGTKHYFDGVGHTYITESSSDTLDFVVGGQQMLRMFEGGTDQISADDNVRLGVGSSQDFMMWHDTSHTYVKNTTGDLYIQQHADDKDIVFQCDDGSGGVTAYLTIDGGANKIIANENIDIVTSSDEMMRFKRSGADEVSIEQDSSQLYFYNRTTSKVLFLMSETGSARMGHADTPVFEIRNEGTGSGDGGILRFGHSQDSSTTEIGSIRTHLLDGSGAGRAGTMEFWTSHSGTAKIGMELYHTNYLYLYENGDTSDYIRFHADSSRAQYYTPNTYHRFTTGNGYIELGPANSSWGHIQTDRNKFYFNKQVTVDSGIVSAYDEDLSLQRNHDSANDSILIASSSIQHKLDGNTKLQINSDGRVNYNGWTGVDHITVRSNGHTNSGSSSTFYIKFCTVVVDNSPANYNGVSLSGKIYNGDNSHGNWIDWSVWFNNPLDSGSISHGGYMRSNGAHWISNIFVQRTAGDGEIDNGSCTYELYYDINQNWANNFYNVATEVHYPSEGKFNVTWNHDQSEVTSLPGTEVVNMQTNYYDDGNQTLVQSGAVGAPSYSFLASRNTGMYRGASDTIDFTNGGTRMLTIQADGDLELRSDGSSQGAYIERVGGIKFTWDRDSYGTAVEHSIRSDSDNLIISSYDDVTINLDSNNNDGSETLDVRKHATSLTGGTLLFQVDGAGLCSSYGGYGSIDGSAGSPSFRFNNDADTGMYRVGANQLGFSTGGTNRMSLNDNGLAINRNANPNADTNMALNLSGSYGGGIHFTDTLHSGIWCLGSGTEMHFGVGGSTYAGLSGDQGLFMMHDNGDFHADEDVIAFSSSVGSDKKFKKNIKDTSYGLSDVMKMRAVEYDWIKKRKGKHDIGVIAQEIEEIIPEVVQDVKSIGGSEGTHKVVDYGKLASVLIKAIQEQQQQINELKEKLNG